MSQDITQITQQNIRTSKLKNPISSFTDEELNVLYKAFEIDSKKEGAICEVDKKISKMTLAVGGFLQDGLTYSQLIDYLAKVKKIVLDKNSKSDREKELFLKLFQKSFEQKSEIEKKEFLEELKEKGLSSSEIKSITALSTIAVAQFSGFGVYMLASSTASAVAGLFGATLSFGFYTTMSSVISYAIGPVGFILAAIPLYKTFKDVNSLDEAWNKVKTIGSGVKKKFKGDTENAMNIFQYIASIRLMKEGEAVAKRNELQEALELEIKEKDLEISISIDRLKLVEEKEKEIELVRHKMQVLENEKSNLNRDYQSQKSQVNKIESNIQSSRDKIKNCDLIIYELKNQLK